MKPEYEFFDPQDTPSFSWHPAPGDVTGQLEELVLSEDPETGNYTRLLRFAKDADTSPNGTLSHLDFWEEVWIIDGTLVDLRLGQRFGKGSYACRPPGMLHGPWRAPEGALTFEIRYRG